MYQGELAKFFSGVAVKKLTDVEADSMKSNQHEYNGDRGLKELFGTENKRVQYKATFLYIDDEMEISEEGMVTWYDARFNHATRTEWRLYFSETAVSEKAAPGDSLFLCKKIDDTVLALVCKQDSTVLNQIKWLFDFGDEISKGFSVKTQHDGNSKKLDYIANTVLELIGIVQPQNQMLEGYIEQMRSLFDGKFPTTRAFSDFARSTVEDELERGSVDQVLLKWIEREEQLFRILEKTVIEERLRQGFIHNNEVNVDEFINFSLSVQNRRKSRVGYAFENHLEEVFRRFGIMNSRTPITENRARPDFIFPRIELYHNENFPADKLTMLGAKSTCKDRWRQVLSEADRIGRKNLITLEAAISESQTNEMRTKNLQLIVPKEIHKTYSGAQKHWLYTVQDFVREVEEKQKWCQSNSF